MNAKGAGSFVKKVLGKAFTKLDDECLTRHGSRTGGADSVFQKVIPYRFSTPAAATAIGGSVAVTTGSEALRTQNRNKLGTIQSDELANMVSFTRSPLLDKTMQLAETDPKAFQEEQDRMFKKVTRNTYGAEGDLVFALHNLR